MVVLLAVLASVASWSQTVVCDAGDGAPVAYASVFDQSGAFLGITSLEGALPPLGSATSLRLHHVAYEPLTVRVGELPSRLPMTPLVVPMREVVLEKPKSHCLKLTGYYREMTLNVDTAGQVPPVDQYEYGVMQIYLFSDGSKAVKVYPSRYFDVWSSMGLSTPISLRSTSFIEAVKANKRYTLGDAGGYQNIYRDSILMGTIRRDTVSRTIRVDYDYMAPDTLHEGHILLFKYLLREAKCNLVYRQTPYDRVAQSSLLSYRFSASVWLKAFGKVWNQWSFSEFYPDSAVYLTKEEYKADRRIAKSHHGQQLTQEELAQYAAKLSVPPLAAEMQQMIERSKRLKETSKKGRS